MPRRGTQVRRRRYNRAIRVLLPSLRGSSGIAAYTLALAAGLDAHGHEAIVLDEDGGGAELVGPTVVRLPPPPRIYDPLEPTAELIRTRDVARLAREYEVDGVHATRPGLVPRGGCSVVTLWDPVAGPFARAAAAPERGEGRVKEGLWALTDRVGVRRARAIVAVTREVRSGFADLGRPCEYVPPFLPDEAVGPVRAERPATVVMAAGALDLPRKGLDLALAAMEIVAGRVPEARLVLLGGWIDENRRAALPSFCEAHGTVSRGEVDAALAAAGCLLIPSRFEEFGYVGLEAIAQGIPVVCTPQVPYGGFTGGGFFQTPDRSPAGLAERIEAALAARDFEFPAECRASRAIPSLVSLYERSFA